MAWGSRIVIRDEPTAALGVRESSMVLELIKEVRSQGLAVIMISHNLPEVFAVADRITVLRHGRTIVTLDKEETSLEAVGGVVTGALAGQEGAGGGAHPRASSGRGERATVK